MAAAPYRVAFLGLGLMGEKMVTNMVRHATAEISHFAIWNRTANKAKSLAVALGGSETPGFAAAAASSSGKPTSTQAVVPSWFEAPQEAVKEADYVFLMLFDAAGTADVLKTLPLQGKVVINHGTVSPEQSRNLQSLVEGELKGTFVECPLLGNPIAVSNRKATFMIATGVDESAAHTSAVANAVAALVSPSAADVMRIGAVGTAAALKLSANNLLLAHLSAFSTSYALATRSGVPASAFIHLVSNSLLNFPYYPKWGQRFSSRDYTTDPTFSLEGAYKDGSLVMQAATAVGLHPTATEGSLAIIKRSIKAGHAGEDMSAAYEGVFIAPE